MSKVLLDVYSRLYYCQESPCSEMHCECQKVFLSIMIFVLWSFCRLQCQFTSFENRRCLVTNRTEHENMFDALLSIAVNYLRRHKFVNGNSKKTICRFYRPCNMSLMVPFSQMFAKTRNASFVIEKKKGKLIISFSLIYKCRFEKFVS